METFFAANPGLSARVAHPIEFADYTHEELTAIAEVMLVQDAYRFDDEARNAFAESPELRMVLPRFVNARGVRNALERARLRQADRLVETAVVIGREDPTGDRPVP